MRFRRGQCPKVSSPAHSPLRQSGPTLIRLLQAFSGTACHFLFFRPAHNPLCTGTEDLFHHAPPQIMTVSSRCGIRQAAESLSTLHKS